jgi:Tfp pilus assembly protein PilO
MNALLRQMLAVVRQYPLATISLIAFTLLSAANYFLWDHQKSLVRRHDEILRSGESMLQALAGHTRITAELAAVQEALEQIDRNLIVEGDLATNLGYFYEMENQGRVRLSQLNQLSSLPPPEGNPYKAVPFSLRVTGSYPQVINFVHELETGPRLLRIKSFSFSRSDARSNTLALDLIVELLGSQ